MENASFNPLIFACTGGAGPTATKVMKRLATKLCVGPVIRRQRNSIQNLLIEKQNLNSKKLR